MQLLLDRESLSWLNCIRVGSEGKDPAGRQAFNARFYLKLGLSEASV